MNEAILRCTVCGWPVPQSWVYPRLICDSCAEWADAEIEQNRWIRAIDSRLNEIEPK